MQRSTASVARDLDHPRRYAPPPAPPPPPPQRPTDDLYDAYQKPLSERADAWAPTTNTRPPAPVHRGSAAQGLGDPLKDWTRDRTRARAAVESHVKWLESLRHELTAHCYGAAAANDGGRVPDFDLVNPRAALSEEV